MCRFGNQIENFSYRLFIYINISIIRWTILGEFYVDFIKIFDSIILSTKHTLYAGYLIFALFH